MYKGNCDNFVLPTQEIAIMWKRWILKDTCPTIKYKENLKKLPIIESYKTQIRFCKKPNPDI